MYPSLLKSLLPHRVLYPQRRRFRDNAAPRRKSALIRLIGFFIGGVLLANLVLLMSATLRGQTEQAHPGVAPQRGPAAAIAATQTASASTDGRAIADAEVRPTVEHALHPAVRDMAAPCAALAREKLATGLTHYYLQRSLRPRAPSEGVADTASITNLLAGPGDPAAATPDTSCTG